MKVIPEDPVVTDIPHCDMVHEPARDSILQILKGRNYKVAVELGVQYGKNVDLWLTNKVFEKVYGVDVYNSSIGTVTPQDSVYRDYQVYGFALGRLWRFGDAYTHIKALTTDALHYVPGQVDFVYMDAGKTKQHILDDLIYWYPKVKDGGIMCGHDYIHSSYPHITKIVNDFFEPMGVHINSMSGGIWWVEKNGQTRNNQTISVVIPYYNASAYIDDVLSQPLADERVSEIIIVDDVSAKEDYELLIKKTSNLLKVKVFQNAINLGELKNRIKAAELASNDWVIFLDCDNSLEPDYIESIYRLPKWKDCVIYCPDYGNHPSIDYREFGANYFGYPNIGHYLKSNDREIRMFLNTGNYFMNKNKYLETARKIEETPKEQYGDIVFNHKWMEDGNQMFIVNGMNYVHRIRKDSAWQTFATQMQPIVDKLVAEMKIWNLQQ